MPYAELQKLRAEAAEAADLRRQLRFQADTHKLELDVLLAEIARLKGEKAAAKPRNKRGLGRAEEAWMPESLAFYQEFRECWQRFIAWRRREHPAWSTKKPWAERQLAFLAKLGPEAAIESIEEAMRNGWQGLFVPKGAKRESEGGVGAPAYHRPI